jgi:hypothetical protein
METHMTDSFDALWYALGIRRRDWTPAKGTK